MNDDTEVDSQVQTETQMRPGPQLPEGITMKGIRRAIQAADDKMQPFRDRRKDNFEMYAGPYYGKGTTNPAEKNGGRSIVNLIAQTVDNYHAVLAPVAIRNQFQAKQGMLVGEGLKLSKAIDNIYDGESICQEVGDPCIFDALAGGLGIAVVGIKAGSDILDVQGTHYDAGKPFVEYIDPDDYIVDSNARRWSERVMEGHRYRVALRYLEQNNLYPPDVIERMKSLNTEGAGTSDEKVENMSKQAKDSKDALLKEVELIDLTLYLDEGAVSMTITAKPLMAGQDDADDLPLSVRPYQGPPKGQYVRLAPLVIPSNLQPHALATVVADQHISADRLAAKMVRQMLRAKSTFAYNRSATDDAIQVANSADGDAVAVDDVNLMKEISTGGLSTDFYTALDQLFTLFNQSTGQAQQLGGESGDNKSGTAFEANILQQNLQTRLSRFKEQVEKFFEDISAKLAWYVTTDPLIKTPVNIRMSGGESIDLEYSAETRRGDFLDFNYNVRVSRAKKMSPEMKAQAMMALFKEVVPSILELSMAGAVNFTTTMTMIMDTLDMTDMEACFTDPAMMMQTAQMMQPTIQGAGKGQPSMQQPGQPPMPGGGGGGFGGGGPGAGGPPQAQPPQPSMASAV